VGTHFTKTIKTESKITLYTTKWLAIWWCKWPNAFWT